MSKPAILVIAHAHPDFSRGGGEIAAYACFKGYEQHQATGAAYFLARIWKGRGDQPIHMYRKNEYLWDSQLSDSFYLEGMHAPIKIHYFKSFLRAIKPDIVHIHHLANIGFELIEIIRRTLPHVKLYMTLHEYMAICNHCGQMMTIQGDLCDEARPESCKQCFPEHSEEDFWQRKRRLLHYFGLLDGMITPSNFLQNRYISWGIPANKIHTIENGLRKLPALPRRLPGTHASRNHFAFFGTINQFKGLKVVFQALDMLSSEARRKLSIEIHGANFEAQPPDFKEEITGWRKRFEQEGILAWQGEYGPKDLPARMASVDWVLVPSVWWENSPVVIQEAFALGRPVITSNIGGMAEKVRHGVDGLHVAVKNPRAWADVMLDVCENNDLWEKLAAGIKKPVSQAESVNAHLQLMGVEHGAWLG